MAPSQYAEGITASCARRGEFRTLFLHAVRQSGGLFFAALAVGAVVFCTALFCNTIDTQINADWISVIWLIGCLGVVTAFTFCGSVFSADQKKSGAFFAERGISPGKVWWSRILAFGGVYFGIGLLFVTPLFYVITVPIITAILCDAPVPQLNDKYIGLLLHCTGCYVSVFFIGQLISLFFRSGIISIVLTGTFTFLFFLWTGLLVVYLGNADNVFFVAILTGGPLLLGCLVASRLRMDDWLRGRSLWKSRRPVLTALCLPPLIVLFAIPPYRIYSVPVVDLGYRVDPMVLERKIEWEPSVTIRLSRELNRYYGGEIPVNEKPAFNIDAVKKAMFDPNTAVFAYHCYDFEREVLRAPILVLPYAKKEDSQQSDRILLDKIDPAKIDEAIAFLRQLGEDRPPSVERLKRVYEVEYRLAQYGYLPQNYDKNDSIFTTLAYLKWLPWERTRLLRRLAYEFQMQSYLAEKFDDFVFRNNGDFDELDRIAQLRRNNNHSSLFESPFQLFYPWTLTIGTYEMELRRRGMLIQFALVKYRKEQGRLPETLDELVTVGYLDEIPLIPGSGKPFYYDPHPTDIPDSLYSQYKAGNPILWGPHFELATRYDDEPRPNDFKFNNGYFFNLNFTD